MQPRGDPGAGLEAGDGTERGDKRILKGITCVLFAAHEPPRRPEQGKGMLPHQDLECMAVPCPQTSQEVIAADIRGAWIPIDVHHLPRTRSRRERSVTESLHEVITSGIDDPHRATAVADLRSRPGESHPRSMPWQCSPAARAERLHRT